MTHANTTQYLHAAHAHAQDGTKIAVGEQRNWMSSINVLQQAIASMAVHDWEEAQTLVAKQRQQINHSIARNAPLTQQYTNPTTRPTT